MTDIDLTFASIYSKNGYNGTRAYLLIKPNVSPQVAGVQATRLLKKDSVKQEVDRLRQEMVDTLTHSKPELLKRAHNYEVKADKAKKYETCLKSIDLQAKIAGHYTQDTGDLGQFDKIIAACQVNVTVNTGQDATTIDITPDKEAKKDK